MKSTSPESTNEQLLALIKIFIENSFGYLKLLIPLYIIYKLYLKYHLKLSSGPRRSFLIRFLDLYTFGTSAKPTESDDTIPLSVKDLPKEEPPPPQASSSSSSSSSGEQDDSLTTTSNKLISFLICFFGLQISFVLWGVMQERIIKYGYKSLGNDKEKFSKFKNSQFLVLSNRIAGLFLSLFVLIVFNMKKFKFYTIKKIVSTKNWAPLFICSYSSLSNVLSSWFQYEALKFVSFSTQLLAKSSKSVFVMITGTIISRKKYNLDEYVSVLIIAFGIFLFSDMSSLNETHRVVTTTLPGLICILGYLISDSFTCTWQDNLIKTHSMSSMSLMLMTNLYSCLFTLASLINEGQLVESINFMSEYSDIMSHLVLFSLASAIGQIFIFITIQKFGALVFTLIMTSRQVLSIAFSSIIFQHSLSAKSVLGIFFIFLAIFFQQFSKFYRNKKRNTKPNSKVII